MDFESQGRAGPFGLDDSFANGNTVDSPPPSTLAAQLVENISASARSSRPDETSELKRFIGVIESVKNDPALLKTPDERVGHNHMLIYVCARVALDGLKWDDPFADLDRLRTEALKAINFFKVTIKETPAVLQYTADGGSFLLRGQEPLWLWLFPRVLRLLGHRSCLPLTEAIEAFFLNVLQIVRSTSMPWDLEPLVLRWFQECSASIVVHLDGAKNWTRLSLELSIPPMAAIESLVGIPGRDLAQSCSCNVTSIEQAVRQAVSILSVLKTSSTLPTSAGSVLRSGVTLVWILDSVVALQEAQQKLLSSSYDVCDLLIQLALDIAAYAEQATANDNALLRYKACAVLVVLCRTAAQILDDALNDGVGVAQVSPHILSLACVRLAGESLRNESISRLVTSQLLESVEELISSDAQFMLDTDFRKSHEMLRQATTSSTSRVLTADLRPDKFTDPALRRHVSELSRVAIFADEPQLAAKRRKVSMPSSSVAEVIARLSDVLLVDGPVDASDASEVLLERFPDLDDHDRCTAINMLAVMSCAADDTLTLSDKTDTTAVGHCRLCDASSASASLPDITDHLAKAAAFSAFVRLIRLPSFLASKRPRVVAMIAARRLLRHSEEPDLLDLEKSPLSQWCLQSLQSSLRELRIAAGRTLAVLLGNRSPSSGVEEVIRRNRVNALGLLKTLSERDLPQLSETCIMAWGQTGRVLPDEGLNLVLVKLLDYLGKSNMLISALAFNEILNLAESRRTTPKRLLQPFWKSLAFSVVKDLVSRPQTTRMVAELLQISVPELLLLLQSYALPWLVLTKKRDVIQKIAEARGEKTWQPCLDNANLGPILALLLVQDVPNVDEYVMALFRDVSSHFNNSLLSDLFRAEPLMIALELLKLGGDADEARKAKVEEALIMVSTVCLGDPKDRRTKRNQVIGRFIQQYALGLVTLLAETINDVLAVAPPVLEQKRYISAMDEMIRLCKSYVRIARPQISACLMSALSFDELRPLAFSCWARMLTSMEDEDVEALLESTFFIIRHYWQVFDEQSKEVAEELLKTLLTQYETILKDCINKLPSLSAIDRLASLDKKLNGLREPLDTRAAFALFAVRLSHENAGVVQQTLDELVSYLRVEQGYLQASAISEQPDSVILDLMRSLLDCSAKYNGEQPEVTRLCTECIGLVGCLDSNRLEITRGGEQGQFVLRHNFENAAETGEFVAFVLENVLVKAFQSATDPGLQGFLSYAMQELLIRCEFKSAYDSKGAGDTATVYGLWLKMPEQIRDILTPFLNSKYVVTPLPQQPVEYPIFRPGRQYANWLRTLALDLLRNSQNGFADMIFEPLSRVIRVKDLSVAEFLLPYLVVHVVVGEDKSSSRYSNRIKQELLGILQYEVPLDSSYLDRENARLLREAVFRILDYSMRWLQVKNSQGVTGLEASRCARVEAIIKEIPAELLTQCAIDCKQYARALFYLEPHIDQKIRQGSVDNEEHSRLMKTLSDVYTQIDDPDGLEGISARLDVIDFNQQILSHRKAGRWTAVQTWYEIRLAEEPDNLDVQLDLLTCLKESGQHDVLLNYVEGMKTTPASIKHIVPFAIEASWVTGRWETLRKYAVAANASDNLHIFNLGIAQALWYLSTKEMDQFTELLTTLRDKIASSMTWSSTASLHASHDAMLKCQVLADLELIVSSSGKNNKAVDNTKSLKMLERRLDVLGPYGNDKQYLLGIRRAAMTVLRPKFANSEISPLWLASARLARKAGAMHQSFNAVLKASQLQDKASVVENARLLWKEGHSHKAIQILQSAINTKIFTTPNEGAPPPTSSKAQDSQRNEISARAHLLLAKWLDSAGQTQSRALREQYQLAAKTHAAWEKGHYYLGRHYKKVLESEKSLRPEHQSDEYLTGETAKLVIENYLRSLNYGTKYLYQTLPRILTLWLDMGAQVNPVPQGKVSISRELQQRRSSILAELHGYFKKHIPRMPAYIFYTALPQLVARIAHPNPDVFFWLQHIIVKVVEAHPRQALWSLFACMTTKQQSERRARGQQILQTLRGTTKKVEGSSYELKQLLRMGEKLAEQLLYACNNGDFQSNRTTTASITRDLNFNHKCTPCPLVVPIEQCLMATLPTLTDNVRKHKAFSRDVITIHSFLDEVLVLGSLAKPRRLSARGSDGKIYNLLIKPKDDLRTDQRLMEFNSMINRSLKRDAESSRRQLYIKTYAVTPLNEECGIIEWVDGLKTMRDILLNIYKVRGVSPNYGQIQQLMKEASTSEANITRFTEDVLNMFPPVLPDWFVNQFPNPSAWFAARLKYTRSCAVMSMVGTILGLGDRHGENILLEEGNGGVFHVDFNCLFDKGLTFAQPERVPFRLTHNMVSAMGIYGYEGPFRQCSELTLRILRQQEETLMTILEAFIYDPTLDLQRDKKRKNEVVKLNPTSVVESIKRKVRGFVNNESIPLGVEGQVQELIRQAVDPKNLAAMYIGWCPFL